MGARDCVRLSGVCLWGVAPVGPRSQEKYCEDAFQSRPGPWDTHTHTHQRTKTTEKYCDAEGDLSDRDYASDEAADGERA